MQMNNIYIDNVGINDSVNNFQINNNQTNNLIDDIQININDAQTISGIQNDNGSKTAEIINHSNNIQMWHIVAPSVWAYWSFRAKTLANYYNRLFYLLPFEYKFFKPLEIINNKNNHSFISTFIGYPATFQQKDTLIKKDNNLLCITIGSRIGEICRHKNLIISIIMRLAILNENFKFAILTTKETAKIIKKSFDKIKNVSFYETENEKKTIIQKSILAIAKSGTNNIEIGSLGTPMVTYYKTSWLTYLFAKVFAKTKFINLFNITLNKQIIPEFIQNQATTDNIVCAAYNLITDDALRNDQINEINKAINLMQRKDKKNPIEVVADEISSFIKTLKT